MKITVVLCTYNRCCQLAMALESIANLRLPEAVEWEVLVVDNNSRDETPAVIESYSKRHPGRFRYLFEAQQGKSHALNSAIREASGDILAFLDDDVVVEPEWLQKLTASLHTNEWAGAGGRILPQQKISMPNWLSVRDKSVLAPLAIFDLGDTAGELRESPYGTNMAFHKKILQKYGGFRTDLGPCPGSEIRGEDTEFGKRLLSMGERLRYEPSAIVYHPVSKDRLQRKYFLAWWRDKGRANVRELGTGFDTARWAVLGVPLYLFRRLAIWTLRWMITIQPARRFAHKINVWILIGTIVESYGRVRRAKEIKSKAATISPSPWT